MCVRARVCVSVCDEQKKKKRNKNRRVNEREDKFIKAFSILQQRSVVALENDDIIIRPLVGTSIAPDRPDKKEKKKYTIVHLVFDRHEGRSR